MLVVVLWRILSNYPDYIAIEYLIDILSCQAILDPIFLSPFQPVLVESQAETKDERDIQDSSEEHEVVSITWKEALLCKEFYLLWVTRLSVVLITNVVAALYKAFGQTFIYDDHFLSLVGAVCSFFNCSGRSERLPPSKLTLGLHQPLGGFTCPGSQK